MKTCSHSSTFLSGDFSSRQKNPIRTGRSIKEVEAESQNCKTLTGHKSRVSLIKTRKKIKASAWDLCYTCFVISAKSPDIRQGLVDRERIYVLLVAALHEGREQIEAY